MARRGSTRAVTAPMTDEALLQEAARTLEERLGTIGYLRYLRLTRGGKDRFEDLRKSWENVPIEEVVHSTRTIRKKR